MEETDIIEVNDETCARGVKRTSDSKIAEEVSTSKKKRAKKPPAESPEPAQARINVDDQEEQSEESVKRSRMFQAVSDVAEGDISIEELTVALNNAVRCRHLRQLAQKYNRDNQEDALITERDMAAFKKPRARSRLETLFRLPPVNEYQPRHTR